MKVFASLFTLTLIFISFNACVKNSSPVSSDEFIDYSNITDISYTNHVQKLLDENCTSCHSQQTSAAGLNLDSWNNLIKGSDFGEAIIPFDSQNSLMIEMLTKLQPTSHPADQGKTSLDSVKINFLKRWINEGAKNDNNIVPYENSTNLLYVCNQGEAIISIIDTDAGVVIKNVHLTDFGFPTGSKPHHIAFSPDKLFWYVSCISTAVNKVLKFDVATNQLQGEIETDIPALLDHHPTEDLLYVSRFMLNNSTNSIFAINTQNMQPFTNSQISDGQILLPPGLIIPHSMALSKNGKYVYTASFSQDEFLVINHENKEFEDAINLGVDKTPLQASVTPNDEQVYLSCIGTGEILVINVADSSNRFVESAIDVGGQPWHSVFNSDGSDFYVANLGLNNFSAINTATGQFNSYGVGDGSDGLSEPHGIAIDHNDNFIFISNRNTSGDYAPRYNFGDNSKVGTVTIISTIDNSIVKVIEVENFASGIRYLAL